MYFERMTVMQGRIAPSSAMVSWFNFNSARFANVAQAVYNEEDDDDDDDDDDVKEEEEVEEEVSSTLRGYNHICRLRERNHNCTRSSFYDLEFVFVAQREIA
jgi:uncharacterized protein YeaO (DUF488 family)